jgi:hypothetical protein
MRLFRVFSARFAAILLPQPSKMVAFWCPAKGWGEYPQCIRRHSKKLYLYALKFLIASLTRIGSSLVHGISGERIS